MSYVSLVVDLSQFAAVRTVRVFRALKSVNVVPGLKKIVGAIVYSVENLKDVIILTIFILAVFALLGLQVYMGVLTRICIVDYYDVVDVNSVINETTSDYADVTVMNWIAQNDLVHWKYSQTGTGYNKSVTKDDWVKNQSTWYVTEGYSSHSANYILCNNGSGTGACPLGTICIEVIIPLEISLLVIDMYEVIKFYITVYFKCS
jgi:voltage-gated sodium channel type IV alpha